MADELPEGWKKIFDEMPMLGTPGEPYIGATNVRPIGQSTWPENWREHTVYGEDALKD